MIALPYTNIVNYILYEIIIVSHRSLFRLLSTDLFFQQQGKQDKLETVTKPKNHITTISR